MFDFIRNLAKSAEEKRLETLNAYVDGELSAGERRQFEAELAEDDALREQVAQLRRVKQGIGQLPRARAPHNFTLDPAVYGRPQRQPAYDFYPVLRVATALVAFFFIVAVVLDLATPAGGLGQPLAALGGQDAAPAEVGMADEAAAPERAVVEGEPVEVTRVVTEQVETEEMAAAEELAAQEQPAEDVVEEEALEDEVLEEEALEQEAPEAQMEVLEEQPAEEEALDEGALEQGEAEAVEEPVEAPAEEATTAGESVDGEEGPAAAAPAAVTETAPAETLPPPPTLTSEAADTAQEAAAPTAEEVEELPVEEPVDGGLPWLLIAEIAFGIGLLVLLTVTLIMRRNL